MLTRPELVENQDGLAEAVGKLMLELSDLKSQMLTLRRRVETIHTYLQCHDTIVNRYGVKSYNSSASTRLDARDFIESVEGVHSLEYEPDGIAFRWTGPGHFTRFTFDVERKLSWRVRFVFVSLGHLTDSDTLAMDVDGITYPISRIEESNEFVGGPIAPRAECNKTDILLHVPTLFCPHDSGNQDKRQLGVAIASVELEPVE